MARGWRHTKLSLPSALFLYFSGMSVCRFVFILRFHALVGVPLTFACSADHVSDWQPRILLGMIEKLPIRYVVATEDIQVVVSIAKCSQNVTR